MFRTSKFQWIVPVWCLWVSTVHCLMCQYCTLSSHLIRWRVTLEWMVRGYRVNDELFITFGSKCHSARQVLAVAGCRRVLESPEFVFSFMAWTVLEKQQGPWKYLNMSIIWCVLYTLQFLADEYLSVCCNITVMLSKSLYYALGRVVKPCIFRHVYNQGYHFSGISGNLKMSGNSAKVREVREKAQSQGKIREFV